MNLFSIVLRERDYEWQKSIAQCAESYTAKGALRGSDFQLALVDLLVQELELRSHMYLQHNGKQTDFDDFFNEQKVNLHSNLKSRFGVSIPGEERYSLLREKYNAILLSKLSPAPKPSIGFD
jgi:hypothetical protein